MRTVRRSDTKVKYVYEAKVVISAIWVTVLLRCCSRHGMGTPLRVSIMSACMPA